jgi:hypothetical protein
VPGGRVELPTNSRNLSGLLYSEFSSRATRCNRKLRVLDSSFALMNAQFCELQ